MFEKLNTVERWIFDILSLALVVFYSYSAVLDPAATQFHRGIYVVITYVLVFLLYRSASTPGRVFGYVPAFSLDGSASDIAVAFVLIIVGTWAYSWLLSGIRIGRFRNRATSPDAGA